MIMTVMRLSVRTDSLETERGTGSLSVREFLGLIGS